MSTYSSTSKTATTQDLAIDAPPSSREQLFNSRTSTTYVSRSSSPLPPYLKASSSPTSSLDSSLSPRDSSHATLPLTISPLVSTPGASPATRAAARLHTDPGRGAGGAAKEPDAGAADRSVFPPQFGYAENAWHSPEKLGTRSGVGVTMEDIVGANQFRGHVFSIAKDQAGCRMLQKKLDDGDPENVRVISSEVFEHMVELMVDPFGNYLCQKLMEVSPPSALTRFIDICRPHLVSISLNMHGTRAVQKLVEMVSTADQILSVVTSLEDCVVCLVKDLNGNHVIQKCLNCLSSSQCDFIYTAIVGHCVEVATHRHGCCVLQRCVDAANVHQKALMLNEIGKHALALVQDAFGNYVVQYILNLNEVHITGAVVQRLLGHIAELSKQKFSSNVIEKCLTLASPEWRRRIICELLTGGRHLLKELLVDSFANYVVQRALNVSDEPDFSALLDTIRPHLDDLRATSAGKKIAAKLTKRYPRLVHSIPQHPLMASVLPPPTQSVASHLVATPGTTVAVPRTAFTTAGYSPSFPLITCAASAGCVEQSNRPPPPPPPGSYKRNANLSPRPIFAQPALLRTSELTGEAASASSYRLANTTGTGGQPNTGSFLRTASTFPQPAMPQFCTGYAVSSVGAPVAGTAPHLSLRSSQELLRLPPPSVPLNGPSVYAPSLAGAFAQPSEEGTAQHRLMAYGPYNAGRTWTAVNNVTRECSVSTAGSLSEMSYENNLTSNVGLVSSGRHTPIGLATEEASGTEESTLVLGEGAVQGTSDGTAGRKEEYLAANRVSELNYFTEGSDDKRSPEVKFLANDMSPFMRTLSADSFSLLDSPSNSTVATDTPHSNGSRETEGRFAPFSRTVSSSCLSAPGFRDVLEDAATLAAPPSTPASSRSSPRLVRSSSSTSVAFPGPLLQFALTCRVDGAETPSQTKDESSGARSFNLWGGEGTRSVMLGGGESLFLGQKTADDSKKGVEKATKREALVSGNDKLHTASAVFEGSRHLPISAHTHTGPTGPSSSMSPSRLSFPESADEPTVSSDWMVHRMVAMINGEDDEKIIGSGAEKTVRAESGHRLFDRCITAPKRNIGRSSEIGGASYTRGAGQRLRAVDAHQVHPFKYSVSPTSSARSFAVPTFVGASGAPACMWDGVFPGLGEPFFHSATSIEGCSRTSACKGALSSVQEAVGCLGL